MDDLHGAEGFADVADRDRGHSRSSRRGQAPDAISVRAARTPLRPRLVILIVDKSCCRGMRESKRNRPRPPRLSATPLTPLDEYRMSARNRGRGCPSSVAIEWPEPRRAHRAIAKGARDARRENA